jgi:hypothetical protein
MVSIEERIARSRAKTKYLETQKMEMDRKNQEVKDKEDAKRNRHIGALVSKYFPQVAQLKHRRSKAENEAEFALVDTVLSLLAKDKDYISQLLMEAEKLVAKQPRGS